MEDLTKIFTQALCNAEDESEEILTIRLRAQTGIYEGLTAVEFCTAVAAAYPWEVINEKILSAETIGGTIPPSSTS